MYTRDGDFQDAAGRIRQTAQEALNAITVWRSSPAWPSSPTMDELTAITDSVATLLARLGPAASVTAVHAVAAPLLSQFWPREPGPASRAADAIDHLWLVCAHNPHPTGHRLQHA